MRILICGAQGFIGRALAHALTQAGHTVQRGVRVATQPNDFNIDYAEEQSVAALAARLQGVDVLINAVGIIVEQPGKTFDAIHRRSPCAVFAACQQAGVGQVVQISALGADTGSTPYFSSKRAADAFLATQALRWHIVRPGLVYGRDGASARLFRLLASLPLVFLPGTGRQRLQPIHIDDLAAAVLTLLDPATPARQCVELVGPHVIEYGQMLQLYRAAMGFPPAAHIALPTPLIAMAARLSALLPGATLTPDTWKMLQAGNTGDVCATTELLGHAPRAPQDFIAQNEAMPLRHAALAQWRVPLLRAALAVVWLGSGVVSAGIYPVAQSRQLLAHLGLTGSLALSTLYAASVLDVLLGLASLLRPGRRLWLLQIALICLYSALVAIALPEYLIHPFAPILKNLPMLAILMLLYAEETKP